MIINKIVEVIIVRSLNYKKNNINLGWLLCSINFIMDLSL